MSTLTKVFVVVLVVLSIAFTAMTVSVVAQTTNWRATAEKYQEHARVADTNLRNLISANAAQLQAAEDAIAGHQARANELGKKLQESQSEVAQNRGELARVAAEKSSADAMNRGLLAQLQVADAARGEYHKQRDELEKRNIDLERRNIDLNDRVNEQTAKMAVLLEQRRQFEQQLNILRTENEKLASDSRRVSTGMSLEEPTGAALPGVTAVTPASLTAIRGKILEISQDLLTISVGAADGVKKDMVFVIHRDGQYVGDVKINLVDPNQSAGRLVRTALPPQLGDQVTDSLRLGGSKG